MQITQEKAPVAGFDLGSANNSVAAVDNEGKPYHIELGSDRTTVPATCFIENDDQWLVATRNTTVIPEGCILVKDVKRIIGRGPDDGLLMEDIKNWGFPFQMSKEGYLFCQVREDEVRPVEFLALQLMFLANEFAKFMQKTAGFCAIAIPAYFGDPQRRAILDAAKIAKFPKTILINEPTAAAIAYLTKYPDTEGNYFLVIDPGHGTTDVALIYVNNSRTTFEVKCISGNTRLGGADFTNNLAELVIQKGAPDSDMHTLKCACEEAKVSGESPMCIRYDGKTFKVTEDEYRSINKRNLEMLGRVIDEVVPDLEQVDKVIAVGGPFRDQLISNYCKDKVGAQKFLSVRSPTTLVAEGAALAARAAQAVDEVKATQAGKSQEEIMAMPEAEFERLSIADVLGQPIGIAVEKRHKKSKKVETDVMEVALGRTTTLPASYVVKDLTAVDDETVIQIFQGENKRASKNTLISTIRLCMERGVPFEYKIDVDKDGTIRASEFIKGREGEVKVIKTKPGLDDHVIEDLKAKARKRFVQKSFTTSGSARRGAGSKEAKRKKKKKRKW